MAIYRFSASVIGRNGGRSAVAAAAYRAGADLTNERDGMRHNYERRSGVDHNEILAPEGAPDWAYDRAQLWNEVERTERRKDAQLAREITMALPHELSHQERLQLARDFVRDQFVSRGMIADMALHSPDREGDERNVHTHVMLTMRTLDGDGFGKKAREWNDRGLLEGWREQWAEVQNNALERAGFEARVDHRTLEAQGIDQEPEPKLGPLATQLEREGKETNAGNDLRATWKRNAEIMRAKEAEAIAIAQAEEARRAQQAREDFSDLFIRQKEDFAQEQAERQASIDALAEQIEGRSWIGKFWDKLRGRLGWNAELELESQRNDMEALRERQTALESAQEAHKAWLEEKAQEADREAQRAAERQAEEEEREKAELQAGRDEEERLAALEQSELERAAAARRAEIDQLFNDQNREAQSERTVEPNPVDQQATQDQNADQAAADTRQAEIDRLFNERDDPSPSDRDTGPDFDRDR